MTSCDTNILFVALEESRPGHAEARGFLDARWDDPGFGLCELVLLELYILLRNPVVARLPLSPQQQQIKGQVISQNGVRTVL
jgi:predicted nucleic acid-binding protein